MTHAPEDSAAPGRPWPAPSPDADWWRRETAENPQVPTPALAPVPALKPRPGPEAEEPAPSLVAVARAAVPVTEPANQREPRWQARRTEPAPTTVVDDDTTEPAEPVVEAAPVVVAEPVVEAEPVVVPEPEPEPVLVTDVEVAAAEPAEPTTVIHTISTQRSAPEESAAPESATETFVFSAPPPDEAIQEAVADQDEVAAPPALVPQRRSVEGGARPRATAPAKPAKVRSGPPKNPRRPWFALPTLVLLALMATFFGWVSAEPLWLAVGHAQTGTATITHSEGGGLNNRCRGQFIAAGDAFTIPLVRVTGLPDDQCVEGTSVPARAVSTNAREAYAGDSTGLHLRWGIGLGLVLLCGLLIAWLTGAARFAGWQRVLAVGLSIAAPALVTVGMIVAAY